MLAEVHKWEVAGLGRAPFRFIGMRENMWSPVPGVPAKPGGTCAYCSNGIRYEFIVRDAGGKQFVVGSECIRAVEAKGSRLLTDAERAFKQTKKEKAWQALKARMDAASTKLDANPALLTDRPHPSIEKKTLRDYVTWMLRNAGDRGRLVACKIVEAA